MRSNPEIETTVRDTVDFMLGLQQPNGNIAPAMDEAYGRNQRPASEELVHWCHGGPGIKLIKVSVINLFRFKLVTLHVNRSVSN